MWLGTPRSSYFNFYGYTNQVEEHRARMLSKNLQVELRAYGMFLVVGYSNLFPKDIQNVLPCFGGSNIGLFIGTTPQVAIKDDR